MAKEQLGKSGLTREGKAVRGQQNGGLPPVTAKINALVLYSTPLG